MFQSQNMKDLNFKNFADEQSLLIFKIGGDQKNFNILNFIINKKTTATDDIMKKFELTTMPANRRINQLASVGLIERSKDKKDISATKLGMEFIKLVRLVRENLIKQYKQR